MDKGQPMLRILEPGALVQVELKERMGKRTLRVVTLCKRDVGIVPALVLSVINENGLCSTGSLCFLSTRD